MGNSRRAFIRNFGQASASLLLADPLISSASRAWAGSAARPGNKTEWESVRARFTLKPGFINLNNGVSPTITDSLNLMTELNAEANLFPMQGVPQVWVKALAVRVELAELLGCKKEELSLTRSTTEGLNTVISGLDLKAGDEVLVTDHEYPTPLAALSLKALRSGIVVNTVKLPGVDASADEIAAAVTSAITPKTRLVLVSHVSYRTGLVLPIRAIADAAHSAGVEVLVDGAHGFAHLELKISDLGCDYYAAPLHKWLCGPQGGGLLYVRQDRVERLWPLFGGRNTGTDASKLQSPYTYLALSIAAAKPALALHREIGPSRKLKRLRELRRHWMGALKDVTGITLLTPDEDAMSCGIGAFRIEGIDSYKFQDHMMKLGIAVGANGDDGVGNNEIRITPNIYTLESEVDSMLEVTREIARAGRLPEG